MILRRKKSLRRIWGVILGLTLLTVPQTASAGGDTLLPTWELRIIHEVAKEYNLSDWQTALLIAIRKAENGKTPKEFGVLTKDAMRFSDPEKSFLTQARWAAGSIKKRCGDKTILNAFAARWAPLNAKNDPDGLNNNWLKNVRFFLKKQGF